MKLEMRRSVLVHTVPILSAAGWGFATALALPLLNAVTQTSTPIAASAWADLFMCLCAALICAVITLWWGLALMWYHLAVRKAIHQGGAAHLAIPSWAPRAVKVLATATLGFGALTPTAAGAGEVPIQLTVTEVQEELPVSGFFSKTPADSTDASPDERTREPSHFFSQPTPVDQRLFVPVSQVSHQPLSPLFGALSSAGQIATPSQGPQEEHSPTAPSQSSESLTTYTVSSGDTLWSIAENLLPPEASGAEILTLVMTIQGLNSADIPTLDSLIFPGQIIFLPTV